MHASMAVVAVIIRVFAGIFSALAFFVLFCRVKFGRSRKVHRTKNDRRKVVAFFHPYCSAGGGGERVLWKAIQVLGDLNEEGLPLHVVIYTVDTPTATYKQDLLRHVQARFSIVLPDSLAISFVHLHEHAHYLARSSRFSLIAESMGTMRLAYKALQEWTPDVYMDTTGCAFTYAVARVLAGCRVAAYVHYPTISTDMLALVWERRPSYNHDARIAQSNITTYIKLLYYTLFAVAYGAVGSLASLVMVNSSWTYGHIHYLWRGAAKRIRVVFPPCDVKSLENLCLDKREPVVVSIGQFRPEKNHALQIQALSLLHNKYSDLNGVKLVLVGSCRGKDDEARVQQLRDLVQSLHLTDSVVFILNQPYSVVKEWFGRASVGLHTMWNEHFGIGVVEMMAAGMLVVAHNSGGPKADIVIPWEGQSTGLLASTAEEYADAIHEALVTNEEDSVKMRQRARISAARFSDEVFASSFKVAVLQSGIFR